MIDEKMIVAPIWDILPCGDDMSFSREFDEIQESRRQDDPTLDQGDWVISRKDADWPQVAKQCTKLLCENSKDIRLAMWLAEALSKTDGFAGLAQGYNLLAELIDRFWEHIHPLPENNDQENRIGNLSWLANCSARLINEIPITDSPRGYYSMSDYEAARTLQATLDRDPDNADKLAADKITFAQIDAIQRDTSPAFYTTLVQDTKACAEALEKLDAACNEKLGLDGPSFAMARDALSNVATLINRFAVQPDAIDNLSSIDSEAIESGNSLSQTSDTVFGGVIKSRSQALQQLRIIANYFRATEPHSPVAYIADKAAQWGEMPLHAWLQTVVKDQGALAHIEELLGVEKLGFNSET